MNSVFYCNRPWAIGQPAPEVSGVTSGGKEVALSDLKGKVVYVDVWATWCKPCLEEFPSSIALQHHFNGNDQLTFLYVSVDQDQEKWKQKLTSDDTPTGLHIIEASPDGTSPLYESYKIHGIPRYILIDREGRIADANAPRPS